jgi:hypothetical protein
LSNKRTTCDHGKTMMLYRATTTPLEIGATLTRECQFPNDRDRRTLEEFLDAKRPDGSHSRLASWFACDKPGFAAKYLEAEFSFGARRGEDQGERRLYEIEMDAPSKQPMILVNPIAKRLVAGEVNAAELLAREYWNPTKVWRFWEYTSPKITVLRELPWPDDIELQAAFTSYAADSARMKEIG